MRRVALALLCAIAVLAGACGIPYDRAPQSLPLDQLPAQLTKPVEPAPPTTSPARPGRETVADLYYVENSLLAQFPTTIAANPASLDDVLRMLGAGPTIRVAGSGVRSYLPVGAITGLASKGVAYIGLDPTYFELPRARPDRLHGARDVPVLEVRPIRLQRFRRSRVERRRRAGHRTGERVELLREDSPRMHRHEEGDSGRQQLIASLRPPPGRASIPRRSEERPTKGARGRRRHEPRR